MKKREKPELKVAIPNTVKKYTDINLRRKANQIANTVRENNCDIVKITKGKTSIIMQKNIGNQVDVVVPDQVPIEKLLIQLTRRLRGYKHVKIEIIGFEEPRRKEVTHGFAMKKHNRRIIRELNKGDDDDGSGTSGRNGRIKRKKK